MRRRIILDSLAIIGTLFVYVVITKRPKFEWLVMPTIAVCSFALYYSFVEEKMTKRNLTLRCCKKKYEPNRRLFIPLLVLFIGVTCCASMFPMNNPWFNIITGIGSGGIASVVIAWLIEAANCKEKEEKDEAIYSIPWASLSMFAYSYACTSASVYAC